MAASGDKLIAMGTVADIQTTSGTTTSTGKTSTLTGGTACGVAFVAPPSGVVLIHNACDISNSGANFSLCSVRVRTGGVVGSGSDYVADSDTDAIYRVGAGPERFGVEIVVAGLTPGSTYNAQQRFSVGGGTGTFFRKVLIVKPQL